MSKDLNLAFCLICFLLLLLLLLLSTVDRKTMSTSKFTILSNVKKFVSLILIEKKISFFSVFWEFKSITLYIFSLNTHTHAHTHTHTHTHTHKHISFVSHKEKRHRDKMTQREELRFLFLIFSVNHNNNNNNNNAMMKNVSWYSLGVMGQSLSPRINALIHLHSEVCLKKTNFQVIDIL